MRFQNQFKTLVPIAVVAVMLFATCSADAVILFRDDFNDNDSTFNQTVQNNTSLS